MKYIVELQPGIFISYRGCARDDRTNNREMARRFKNRRGALVVLGHHRREQTFEWAKITTVEENHDGR